MTTLDLTEHAVTREGQTWLLRFPRIRNWFDAVPETDPETYRGLTLDDLATALGYATSLVAIASAYLRVFAELDDCDDIFCQIDDGDPSMHVSTSVPNARQSIAQAVAEGVKVLSGEASTTGAADAASDLIARQRDRARRDSIERRLTTLAQGDNELHNSLFRQIPNMYVDLDGAEAAVTRIEREVRESVIQRAAMQQAHEEANQPDGRAHAAPDAITHTVNEHATEGINQ